MGLSSWYVSVAPVIYRRDSMLGANGVVTRLTGIPVSRSRRNSRRFG